MVLVSLRRSRGAATAPVPGKSSDAKRRGGANVGLSGTPVREVARGRVRTVVEISDRPGDSLPRCRTYVRLTIDDPRDGLDRYASGGGYVKNGGFWHV